MSNEIHITLIPAGRGRYRASLNGTTLCTSGQPFFAASRVLIDQGVSPDTILSAGHQGSPVVALRQRLGDAAKWTVSEPDKGAIRIVPYDPEAEARRRSLGEVT